MSVPRRNQIAAVRNRQAEVGRRRLGSEPHVQLSYWKFSTYLKCPQQFLLHCIASNFKVTKDDSYYAVSGSVVHGLFEDFFREGREGRVDLARDRAFLTDQATQRYDKFVTENKIDWDIHRVEPKEHRDDQLPEIVRSLDWTYDELHRVGILPRSPDLLFPEYKFRTQLVNPTTAKPVPVILTGRVDLVVKPTPLEDQFLRIVDYKDVDKKTSSSMNWRQLVWYPMGVEWHFKMRCNWSAFCLTKLRTWMPKNPDAVNTRDPKRRTFRNILYEEMLNCALDVRRGVFPAKVSRHHCHYCPVKDECPEWYDYAGHEQELMADLAALTEGTVSFE